jgi:proline iminopeptidase
MFYDASNFDKIIAGGGSISNDVYCAMAGEDADFLIAGDLGNVDFRRDLSKITAPMLILAGRYDRVAFPRWTIQYKRYAPKAKFVMFEKSGHFPFIEQTDETMGVLREFLQR